MPAGRPSELAGVHTLTIRLDEEQYWTLEKYAAVHEISKAEAVRRAIEALGEKPERKK